MPRLISRLFALVPLCAAASLACHHAGAQSGWSPPKCRYGLEPGGGPMRCADPADPNSFLNKNAKSQTPPGWSQFNETPAPPPPQPELHRLYAWVVFPVFGPDDRPIVRNGEPLYTHVCYVTLNSAHHGLVDVPVEGYRSPVSRFAIYQFVRNRRAELREADFQDFEVTSQGVTRVAGSHHVEGLRFQIPLLDEKPRQSPCTPDEWLRAERTGARFRPGTEEIPAPPPSPQPSPNYVPDFSTPYHCLYPDGRRVPYCKD